MASPKFSTIDEYLSLIPEEHLGKLQQIRETIRKAIPEANEVISYNLPAFKYKRVLVSFALSKAHIGFYPTPSGIEAFKEDLKEAGYTFAKGSVQFPLDEKLPLQLISDMARFRLEEDKLR